MKTGYNALFIPGPTNIPNRIKQSMVLNMEDMRASDFGEFTLPLFRDLKKIFKSEKGRVFIFPSSGTGGWESALTNTLSTGDGVLCSSFGQFSVLWCAMCRALGFDVNEVEVEWGKGIPIEEYARILEADKAHNIKAVLVCQNETATGVCNDVVEVRKVLDSLNHPALLYVDGISSIASVDFRMDEWGVDVAIAGTQKGFMMPTGMSVLCVSEKALEASKTATCPRSYFSWQDMIVANDTGYFPYTPATTLLRGLREAVDMLLEEGLENVFARHHHIASGVRAAVQEGWGLQLCARETKWYSDTVSAILVPEGKDAKQVIARAYDRYNLSLGSGLTQVAGKVFRIGHLGWLNEVMVMQAIAGAEMAMLDSGIDVTPGSGVAAAMAVYRQKK